MADSSTIGCNFLLCEVSEVQNFERHPRLAQYIERMANTGKTGNTHEWCDFLMLLNTALDDERKRKAPCEQFCEATAFNAEIRRLKAKINDADYLIGAFERGCVSGDYFMDIAHYKGT